MFQVFANCFCFLLSYDSTYPVDRIWSSTLGARLRILKFGSDSFSAYKPLQTRDIRRYHHESRHQRIYFDIVATFQQQLHVILWSSQSFGLWFKMIGAILAIDILVWVLITCQPPVPCSQFFHKQTFQHIQRSRYVVLQIIDCAILQTNRIFDTRYLANFLA